MPSIKDPIIMTTPELVKRREEYLRIESIIIDAINKYADEYANKNNYAPNYVIVSGNIFHQLSCSEHVIRNNNQPRYVLCGMILVNDPYSKNKIVVGYNEEYTLSIEDGEQ